MAAADLRNKARRNLANELEERMMMLPVGRPWLAANLGLAAILALGLCTAARADDVLFENVRIFDGKSAALSAPSNVLVKGNVIERISTAPIAAAGTLRIAGNGRTLMPGLIDNHWHAMLARLTPSESLGDIGFANLMAGDEATDTLMRGFTTVRDVGGPAFGLKRAIDQGIVKGPRIYPSGAMITVTSGHGDFRQLTDLPRTIGGMLARMEQVGGSMVADSPDEVRVRVREQLMQGASQVKLTAGGGVSSPHSPLDVTTFTEAELRAAVEAAENWGTYVVAHAFTPAAIQRAIAAGVKCIEHGFLMDEATARLIAEKGVWLSLQPLPDELKQGFPPGSVERAKADEAFRGIGPTYELAKKHKIKTAWGTDVLFSRALAQRQGAILASLVRWHTPAEALVMATGTNAELLALSGKRNPYPGKLGVVEQGALADLLLVDGNPLDNINLIADPANSFKIIMKDGVIYKNTLTK
jgi:imidazolonepropionase-like amidohydrolase